jgi:hypothetical protein
MTKLESRKLFAMLVGALPSAKVNEGTADIYAQMLGDLEFDIAQRAVARLLSSWEMACLPTIGEIRRTATDLRLGPVRPGGEAWGDVQDAMRRVGGYEPEPTFEDPIVARVVASFGWRALCFEGDGTADRARFVQAYDALAKQARVDAASGVPLPRPLSGLAQAAGALPNRHPPADATTGILARADGHPEAPHRFDPRRIPRRNPDATWTGRVLTVEELDAELAAAQSPREQTP